MNNYELCVKLVDIAKKYKTLYVMGCFGAPLTTTNKMRYIKAYSYNQSKRRQQLISKASSDTFGFDCVNVIKAVLWGWKGDKNAQYGGAIYKSNGVPDIGADEMITRCKDISTNFKTITVGEAVWLPGHIGVYIGGGLAVECTPKWADKVQITACNCIRQGYETRTWTKHGKLPYITYIPEGDVDGDGKVTAEDARLALRAAVGLEELTEAQKNAADTDNDGKVTAADARNIMKKAVEK